ESDSILKAMELVQSGELDLMGFMLKNPATQESFEYPQQKYGVVYNSLLVDENQTIVNESSYMWGNPLRVAVINGANTRNAELEQFMAMNNINYQMVVCETQEQQENAIKNGKADVMLHVTLRPIDGTRQVEKFSPRPFYFVTTKGNKKLAGEIDTAISKINATDPYYEARLFTQHFGNPKGKFWLSSEEKEYIAQKKKINVLVLPQSAPFAAVDEKGDVSGISRFILEGLKEDTGLDMNFIKAEKIDDMPAIIKKGDIDIVYGVSSDVMELHHMGTVMSQPYIRVDMAAFYNSKSMGKEKDQCVLATSEAYPPIKAEDYKKVQQYKSVEECIKAVNSGKADVGFANSYSVDFYSMSNRCTNLQVLPVTGSVRTISFGVVDPDDTRLLSIINKRVRTIGADEIDGYLLQEVSNLDTNSPANFIKSNMALTVGMVSVFLFAVATAVTLACINGLNRKKNAQLTQAYAEAEKANQAKTEFLARMSHEMRTPLSAVIGMTNIARENAKGNGQVNSSLDTIDVASEHLLQIINDVLDMTRINEGKLELRAAPFDFKQMLASLEVIYREYA
ncbi:MAG: transporter substrate-binding domain-containing protein, partial [Oscillospiraceae bacterium]